MSTGRRIGIALVAPFLALLAAAATAEDPPPSGAFEPHFTLRWDFLARYDNISHLVFIPNISRGRFELRPEVSYEISDRFRIATRAIGDFGTDQNSQNARNFDNYRSRGVSVERYYLEAKPGNFVVLAGAFGMPILATEMLWDHDIQTPGAFVSYQTPTGSSGSSALIFSGAGFYGPQSQRDHTRIGVGQAMWRFGDPDGVSVEAATAFWYFEPKDLKLFFADGRPDLIRQNYVAGDGRSLVSNFRILDAIVRLRFRAGRVPVLVSLDGLKNLGSRGVAEGDDEAFEANVTVGRVGTPGDWRAFYTFQYVERDALLGAYNTDDWWFHTWYRGHRIGVAATIVRDLFLQTSVIFQERLDRKSHLNRVLVDLVKIF